MNYSVILTVCTVFLIRVLDFRLDLLTALAFINGEIFVYLFQVFAQLLLPFV